MSFQSTSQGDPASYRWTFPGGTPNFSTSPNATSSWTEPGPKTVTLEIKRGSETDTVTREITILRPAIGGPDSPFGVNCSPSSMSTGDTATCSLVGDPNDFWDLAFSSTVPNPSQATRGPSGPTSYTVSSAVEGTITVTLTGRDKVSGNDRSDTFSISVANTVIQVLPEGTVTGPSSVEAGTTNSFSASGTNIASWSWTAQGSPTFSNPSGETTNIRWNNPGTYRIEVVLGGAGSTTISKTVTVTAAAPTFAFNPVCSPTTQPANGTSATTCKLADGNYAEFTGLTYNVSNPSNLELNRWGAPGESYTASFDPGQITVTVTGTHTATGTPVSGGPFTITFTGTTTTPPTTTPPSPFGMSCTSYSVPADGSEVSWCTLDGDLNNFSGLTYSINAPNPGALNSWGDYRGYNVGYAQPGNVTVTLTGTDNATGNPVSASRTITFVEVATTTTSTSTTTTPPPQPSPVSISCSPGSTGVSTIVSCSLTSDPALSSGWNWSPSAPDGSQLEWWPAGDTMSFRYNAAGTVGVTLTATDVATGTPVSASRSITFG
ncbi:MAG: PKD domain-containing protein [Acidimicrobiales bacterium]